MELLRGDLFELELIQMFSKGQMMVEKDKGRSEQCMIGKIALNITTGEWLWANEVFSSSVPGSTS